MIILGEFDIIFDSFPWFHFNLEIQTLDQRSRCKLY